MLTLNYTYRIEPTVEQQAMMLDWLETCRHLYNRCLRDLKDWIASRKCSLYSCSINREYIMSADISFPSYLEQKRQLTQWKKTNPRYKQVHSQVTQDVVKRMHNTWEAFKNRGFGFPRYKKYGRYQSFLFPQFKLNPIENGIVKLPKIGEIKINQHRPIPDGFKVKGVRIVARARGTIWYAVVTIQCDVKVPDPLPFGRGIGIDIGLESFLVTSDNFRVEPALFFRELQSRLKVLQRKVSRKKKRSKNWEKAQLKVARVHHQISNTRKNFHFQTSHLLCDMADMIFVEDINFKMTARGFLGKQMLDGGFGQFRDLLSWVCWKRGKYFQQVDHKYTSQICPECNAHTGKKQLTQRVHNCPECGYSTTRDHASGRVILQRGLKSVPTDCREWKLSGSGVLSGISYLDKCRSRNANLRELEA
ncbi:RNA-guided endonuclease TnpB family protein [Pleurocapsa sp. PCC 7319]|uniref:RNA-guided endonuclease InsQ/TnpB family protein n=1 Tax=Pleurocapsa sp. PCC 7319 TaxID=118161 RepID=UPI00068792EE|nr:RNA-guided endonuclease TnpB family protein [Pleurocapsa sp. PCC 7319]